MDIQNDILVASTEPYKGVRDFYPEDQFIQRYLFEHFTRVCESYGYEEYNASILEPSELYRSKTSDEIVNEQTYSFVDRGGRDVTMRPEMTPTFARMIAARSRDIPLPARWYAIPNVFRYERPQRGRLREHWQLNADIIGANGVEADAEIIALAHDILISFGAQENNFEIHVSDRRLLNAVLAKSGVDISKFASVTRVLDRRHKLEDFSRSLAEVVGDNITSNLLIAELDRTTSSAYLEELRNMLSSMSVNNMIVDTSITRGFDYYTGMVFEVYDTDAHNRRALFGGGRYDNLLSIFGDSPIPAVGFGMGDVTARDFLSVHKLLPSYTPSTELMLCVIDPDAMLHAITLARQLRNEDITVSINFSGKRIGEQIKQADKMQIPFVIAIGSNEKISGKYTLKHLASGNQAELTADRIADHLVSSLG